MSQQAPGEGVGLTTLGSLRNLQTGPFHPSIDGKGRVWQSERGGRADLIADVSSRGDFSPLLHLSRWTTWCQKCFFFFFFFFCQSSTVIMCGWGKDERGRRVVGTC